MDVTNTGDRKGDDVAQLYIHDPVASISQPVRRLRGFQRVTLDPGQKQTVSFTLDKSDFGFYDNRGRFVVEPGRIDVFAGDSSTADLQQSFTVGFCEQGWRSADSHAHQGVDAERHRPPGDDVGHEVLAPVDEGEGHRERVEPRAPGAPSGPPDQKKSSSMSGKAACSDGIAATGLTKSPFS